MAADRLTGPLNRWLGRRQLIVVELGVFVVAFAARVGVVLSGGGFAGSFGYDAPVYFSSADAFVHGRMPYRDFVLLHPPAIMLALSPFAWSARFTGDHSAFLAGCLAFTALGAVNAVLVVRVAASIGLSRAAGLAGGLFYAVWFGSVTAEYSARLEPLGNFFVLSGLLAFFARDALSPRMASLLCGLAFGAAASVKIWWAVPLGLIVVMCARSVGRRRAMWAIGGGAGSIALISGPFFLLAPSQMWHMVVTDQLGRARTPIAPWARLGQLAYAQHLDSHPGVAAGVILVVVCSAVYLVVARSAWRVTTARPIVIMAGIQLLLLCAAPSWLPFYSDYVSVAASLTVAAAVSSVPAPVGSRRRSGHGIRTYLTWVPVAAAAAITAAALLQRPTTYIAPFPDVRSLARAVASERCLMSDSPFALIDLNALSRDLANGCQNWVDVTGRTYGVDKATSTTGATIRRDHNVKWQRDLRRYLLSGNAVVIARRVGSGLTAASMAAITHDGVVARSSGIIVYRTPQLGIG
jgi:alpha-1,2-mannosyltransferase